MQNTIKNSTLQTYRDAIVDRVGSSDAVLCIGESFFGENSFVADAIQGINFVYCHPVENYKIASKIDLFLKYETGSEEGVVALLTSTLSHKESMPQACQEYFLDLDIGYLSSESNVGEEEIEAIGKQFALAKAPLIVVGKDLCNHPQADNIVRLLTCLEQHSNIQIVSLCQNKGALEDKNKDLEEISRIEEFNGSVIYCINSYLPTAKSKLFCSLQFLTAFKLQQGDPVEFECFGATLKTEVVYDENLKGTIGLLTGESAEETRTTIQNYPFVQTKIEKRDV